MEFPEFYIARLPRILFGKGRIDELPAALAEHGRKALIVTGRRSLRDSNHWPRLAVFLRELGVDWREFTVEDEPSPGLIDHAVERFRNEGIEVVAGIGGGSVVDAAKAIAGLLPSGRSVMDYLEDVGQGMPYEGPSLPYIAVPTTAGTGSEATKNAVLSVRGDQGYKKSFRHEQLVAHMAIIDPQLLESCPPELIAAQGMDAFTQLMESYVSLRANPFTDGLALSGLQAFREGFFAAWEGGPGEAADQGRAAMAYAALISGITLAQVGLGSVHGLAQPLGSFFPIPHGVACGTTVAAATAVNVRALRERLPESPALAKYAELGRLFAESRELKDETACDALVHALQTWTDRLTIPRLSRFGVTADDIPRIVANSRGNSMKTNPVELTDEEIEAIVRQRL